MTHVEHNPSNDSVAVANRPQTTGLEGPPQAGRMSSNIVHCGSRGYGDLCRKGDRTWIRLENTRKNGLECTP